FLGQRIHPSSSIWPISGPNSRNFREFVLQRETNSDFEFIDGAQRIPLYFIAIASAANVDLPLPGSTLIDQSDRLFKEKDDAVRWREEQIEDRDETIKSLETALKWREAQVTELTQGVTELKKGLEWTQGRVSDLEKTIAAQQEGLEWRAKQVNELE